MHINKISRYIFIFIDTSEKNTGKLYIVQNKKRA